MTNIPFALVVDDDPLILMHACDILEEAGFQTLDARNGDDALELLRAHAGAVVLLFTDVEMPGELNGFGLAREVARHWPNTGILVASGQINPKDGDLPDGAIFVSKPFSADVVRQRIHELLPDGRKPEPLKRAT